MDADKTTLKQLSPHECYLRRVRGGSPSTSEPKVVTIAKVERFPAAKLAALQYSLDGKRWFTARRLDRSIEYEVFISCSAVDYRKAEDLRGRLQIEKLRAFVATKEILYANDFEAVLRQSIERSLVFVVLLSQHVNNQPENVRHEIDCARRNHKPKIPVAIDHSEMHPDIKWALSKVHQIAAADKPWTEVIEITTAAIFKALGEQDYVPQTSSRVRQSWRNASRVVVTWSRRLALILGLSTICTCLGLGWVFRGKLFPPAVPMAAVVITPSTQPRAFWRDDFIHADPLGPTTNTNGEIVNVTKRLVTELVGSERESVPFKKLYGDRGPRAALSLFKADAKLPHLSNSDFQWFLFSGAEDANPEGDSLAAQALVLTAIGTALEPAFSKLYKPSHSTSWVIVHIDRNRAMFVWYRSSSSGKNYLSWPKTQTFQNADLERLNNDVKDQDEKAPGILSNDIVVFCGETPTIAFRSKVSEDRESRHYTKGNYDRNNPFDHLPWIVMLQGEPEIQSAFNPNHMEESIKTDRSLANLPDVQKIEDLEVISKSVERFPAIINALEIGPRSRLAIVLPFVF